MAYTDKLRVVYGDYTLGVHGEGFDYIFSYAQGGLESIVKNGYEWLYRCPKPTFWRALTDNDRGSKFHIKSGSWLSADMFIDCKGIQVIMDGKEQNPYAPDNNIYGGDVYADEIIVLSKGVQDYFEKTYLSFEMKMAKPEPEIFKAILDDAGIEPEETLFIDDSEINCKAAQNLGISTYTAKAGEDWSHLFNSK